MIVEIKRALRGQQQKRMRSEDYADRQVFHPGGSWSPVIAGQSSVSKIGTIEGYTAM